MEAVLCPVCNGVGKVVSGFYNRTGDCSYWVSSGGNPEVCRSCNGKGWVEIGNADAVGGVLDYVESMFPELESTYWQGKNWKRFRKEQAPSEGK